MESLGIKTARRRLQRLVTPFAVSADEDDQNSKDNKREGRRNSELRKRQRNSTVRKQEWPRDAGYKRNDEHKPHLAAILCGRGRHKARIAALLRAALQRHHGANADYEDG